MKLLTKEIMRAIPTLYSQDGIGGDAWVHFKLFFPAGRYSLYVTEATVFMRDGRELSLADLEMSGTDPEDHSNDNIADVHFYGWTVSPLGEDCDELGTSSLRELQDTRVKVLGVPMQVERDIYWRPRTLREVLPEGHFLKDRGRLAV